MNVQIRETGKQHTLSIVDAKTGVNWINDLIGNADAIGTQFVWDEDADAYLVGQSDYDWWAKYIADREQSDADMRQAAADLSMDIDDVVTHVGQYIDGVDYDMERAATVRALRELREAAAARRAAAAALGRSRTPAKAASSRENGKRGGRPRKAE